MTIPQVKTGLFVGLNKGHAFTRSELAPRPNSRKGLVCRKWRYTVRNHVFWRNAFLKAWQSAGVTNDLAV